MNELFDSMFGADHLSYEQTESKDCIIAPSSQPQFHYNHDEWEKNMCRELNETPVGEPPAKVPKVRREVNAKRSLNMNAPGSVPSPTPATSSIPLRKPSLPEVNQPVSSLSVNFYPSSSTQIRIPRVPPWGGECILEDTGAEITLTNTCPVDNFLTMFFLLLKEKTELHTMLTNCGDDCAKSLLNAMSFFEKGKFARGKVEWLRQFPQFDFSSSGSINVWGNEYELFWKPLAALHPSEVSSRCSSASCPKSRETSSATGFFLHETNQLKPGETYLEAALRDWIMPQPCSCGKEFTGDIPSGVRAVRGIARLDLSTNTLVSPLLCDGVRHLSPRTFPGGKPLALYISMYHFSSNGVITEPQQLPSAITIDGQSYELNGCTFWNGSHYKSCLKYQNHWFSYDGLMESKTRGSGLQPDSLTTLLPHRYWLSSCMYHVLK